jgi:hypothetical protein
VNRSLGLWGIFLPELCHVVTGVLLFVGMTSFQVFSDPALRMAARAFSAYGPLACRHVAASTCRRFDMSPCRLPGLLPRQ